MVKGLTNRSDSSVHHDAVRHAINQEEIKLNDAQNAQFEKIEAWREDELIKILHETTADVLETKDPDAKAQARKNQMAKLLEAGDRLSSEAAQKTARLLTVVQRATVERMALLMYFSRRVHIPEGYTEDQSKAEDKLAAEVGSDLARTGLDDREKRETLINAFFERNLKEVLTPRQRETYFKESSVSTQPGRLD